MVQAAQLFDFCPKLHYTIVTTQQKSSRDSTQSETMTKAVGAALVPEILAQSPPAVKVGAGTCVNRREKIEGRFLMSTGRRESFVRWQGRTIEQLGFVNNLLIGLATGVLAFQTQLAFNDTVSFTLAERGFLVSSITLVFLSLLFGCYIACNRLCSFRTTEQVARKRETNQREGIERLRYRYRTLDKRTWALLPFQTGLFAFGGGLLLVASVLRYLK